jgi:hypothetical protein
MFVLRFIAALLSCFTSWENKRLTEDREGKQTVRHAGT